MGYVTATGELIRFHTPQGPLGGATAAARGNAVFAVRGTQHCGNQTRHRAFQRPRRRALRG